jgi:hypothetical protein
MSYKTDHPEQDPAEGSRDVINRELARHPKDDTAHDGREQQADGERHIPKSDKRENRPM